MLSPVPPRTGRTPPTSVRDNLAPNVGLDLYILVAVIVYVVKLVNNQPNVVYDGSLNFKITHSEAT